ncbi:hypothetical protein HOY80DRAFT_1078542 [Tuber brumale]|nr:hypothetical protein HOY80DRAFT_1078542 [Tuber brumale]
MEMDTIEVADLKRNLRLRASHVGKAVASVAGSSAYMQFKLGICGRDSVEARRGINATLVDGVDNDSLECLKPQTDGGTEISSDGPGLFILRSRHRQLYPAAWMAQFPASPEIVWRGQGPWSGQERLMVLLAIRSRVRTVSLDLNAVFSVCPGGQYLQRHRFLNCGGNQECHAGHRFDKHHDPHILLQGGSGDRERANPYLNQVMYIGNEGVYTHPFEHDKAGTFPDCGNIPTYFMVDHQWSQETFRVDLSSSRNQIQTPTFVNERRKLYYKGPAQLNDQARPNLDKQMKYVVDKSEEIAISDQGLVCGLKLNIVFS